MLSNHGKFNLFFVSFTSLTNFEWTLVGIELDKRGLSNIPSLSAFTTLTSLAASSSSFCIWACLILLMNTIVTN